MARAAALTETLYSIGQVNAITGIPKSTIRFWEKEFSDFLVPLRSVGNQRRYDTKAVKTLKMINQLVNEYGFTLEGARRKLQTLGIEPSDSMDGTEDRLDALADTMTDMVLHRLFEKVKAE